ncbi:MAG: MGMT family protein [Ruminococcus sp.]|nr:MGMT family protein [Ruminococcus sp.]
MKHGKPGNTFALVYEVVRRIPRGKVATYGDIAKRMGNPRWSQVVGYALHVNPEPGVIPCHRVVNRFGETSKAFAFGGEDRQRMLLEEEGIAFLSDGRVDLEKYRWTDDPNV